jgi:TAT (twin-arginine translocation) pathway signal sequence
MNRRSFLRWLGAGIAVGAVAPAAITSVLESESVAKTGYATYVMGQDAVIGCYADYTNFSQFALSESIDQAIQDTANELSYRFAYATDVIQRRIV